MATAKIQIAPARIAEGKRLYEMTLTPVPDIAAMMGRYWGHQGHTIRPQALGDW